MSAMTAETPAPDAPDAEEHEPVEEWRHDQLVRAGYPEEAATYLAHDLTVDLHQAVEMLEHGCSWETAVAILT